MRDVYNPFNDAQYTIGQKVIHNGIEMEVEDVGFNTLQNTWTYMVHESCAPEYFIDVPEDKLYPFNEYPVAPGDE